MSPVGPERGRVHQVFDDARLVQSYDEWPLLPDGLDPQVLLSRNSVPQPFHLICEQDCQLVHVAGSCRVEFASGSVRWFDLVPGDVVDVPAGTPHRLVPVTESIMLRFAAAEAGLEAAAWYCASCGGVVWRHEVDTAEVLRQHGYQSACEEFNAVEELRTCRSCGAVHPPTDLGGTRWPEVAAALQTNTESADA